MQSLVKHHPLAFFYLLKKNGHLLHAGESDSIPASDPLLTLYTYVTSVSFQLLLLHSLVKYLALLGMKEHGT